MGTINLCRRLTAWIACAALLVAVADSWSAPPDENRVRRMPAPERIPAGQVIAAPDGTGVMRMPATERIPAGQVIAAPDGTGVMRMPVSERIPAGPVIAAPSVIQPADDPLPHEAASQTVSGAAHGVEAVACPSQQPRTAPQAPCPNGAPARPCGWCGETCDEVPLAAPVFAAAKTQIRNGLAARMVLYQNDFCDDEGPGGDNLNPHGLTRLRKLLRLLPYSGCRWIMIECTQNPNLDAARRARVVEVLCRMNIPEADQLVAVGAPQTPELRGLEAEIINTNLTLLFVNQKLTGFAPPQGGTPSGSGGSGGGGSMSGGMGGGS